MKGQIIIETQYRKLSLEIESPTEVEVVQLTSELKQMARLEEGQAYEVYMIFPSAMYKSSFENIF